MQTREDNIDRDKKKRNRLLSFSYWLRRFQSHYRGLAKRLICFSCSLVKSEFIGFENPSYGETRKKIPLSLLCPSLLQAAQGDGNRNTGDPTAWQDPPLPCPCLCAGTCGCLAVLLPTPYHLCGVAVMLRKWRIRSEGCNHPPALLCLTWDKSWALSLTDSARANPDPWLYLGFQADF